MALGLSRGFFRALSLSLSSLSTPPLFRLGYALQGRRARRLASENGPLSVDSRSWLGRQARGRARRLAQAGVGRERERRGGEPGGREQRGVVRRPPARFRAAWTPYLEFDGRVADLAVFHCGSAAIRARGSVGWGLFQRARVDGDGGEGKPLSALDSSLCGGRFAGVVCVCRGSAVARYRESSKKGCGLCAVCSVRGEREAQ